MSLKYKFYNNIILSENEVRQEIKNFFNIKELVGRRTYRKYGERAWRFLDYRLLYALLIIRVCLGKKMYVNYNGKQQRGLRTIVQQIVKSFFYKNILYISAHLLGKAADFNVENMTAEEVRIWIIKNHFLFPFKIRLEKYVKWVHLDVIFEKKNKKVYLFNPPTK